MNKKRLLCIVLSFAAVCSLFLVDNSVAWFNTQTGTQLSQELTVPKMDFEFSGELESCYSVDGEEFIVTGQNLIKDDGVISLTNNSTMDTQVRFKIEYPTPDGTVTYAGSADDDISVTFATDKTWTYANGFFAADFTAAEGDGASYDVIEYIGYSDDIDRDAYLDTDEDGRVGTPLSGNVVITFQAKQAGHVDWDEIEWTVPVTP